MVIIYFFFYLDDVRSGSKQQQKKLKDLKKEYEDIEKKCKTKIIEDLANLYYKEPTRSGNSDVEDDFHLENKKKVIKSRSINIEILEDGSVKTSKVIRSSSQNSHKAQLIDEDDESLDKSITISINSKSSRRSQNSCINSANGAAKMHQNVKRSKQREDTENDEDDDDDECDTLNAIENFSVHDDLTESNSKLHQENTSIKNENDALRKKYRKYKALKTKLTHTNAETEKYKEDIATLKLDLGRLLKENTELRLKQSIIPPDSESRRLQRQNSIFEAPVRDSQDQAVQVAVTLERDKGSFSSLEVDYFTEVIIDELKKEIRDLKNQMKHTPKEDNFKAKEETILGKLSKMKIESEKLKNETSKSQEDNTDSSENERLKLEVKNLKKMLEQQQETSATYESYIGLLKSSYTEMFGPIDHEQNK